MRSFIVKSFAAVLVVFAATSAGAINLFFSPPSATELAIGDQFTIELRMDTEGDTQINAVGVSVFADPTLFAFVSGTSPGQILFNIDTFEGVARVSQPFTLATDPDGLVRAASFAALSPSGVGSANQLLATLTFQAVGAGSGALTNLLAQGDDILSNGASVAGSVSSQPSASITVVPEPGTALLMGLGLSGLAVAGRRRQN